MKITRFAPDERGKSRVSVFRRGSTFYARFRIQNKTISSGNLYITETLKTSSEQEANQKAYERLLEIKLAEKKGSSLNKDTVAEAIDDFITEYEDRLAKGLSGHTRHMLRQYRKTICRYWKDYVGKRPVRDISLAEMEAYETWRANYWQRWIDEQKKKKRGSTPIRLRPDGSIRLPSDARLRASNRTVAWEINAFKSFLAWAKRRGIYRGDADLFIFKNGKSSRRSAFTSARIQSHHQRHEAQIMVGGREVSERSTAGAIQKNVASIRIVFSQYGCAGWGSQKSSVAGYYLRKNKDREETCKVWVAQSYSKVQRRREVAGMAKAAEVIRAVGGDRKSKKDFYQPNDFIWCDESGRVIGDFREGFNNLLRIAKAEIDADKKKHTLYCLRHFYITERLREGIPIYEIASNCGTSVSMIEKYYSDARPTDFMDRLTKSRYAKKQPLS